MNDILKDYSQEDIEKLAIQQLQNNDFEDDIPLKIVKVDKEYKLHNKKTIGKAIFNGSIILIFAGIVFSSDSTLADFGTKDLTTIFDSIIDMVSILPQSDFLISIYTQMFEGMNKIIETLGFVGVILAIKSIRFILTTFKDTKQSLKIKKELLELKEKLESNETVISHSK